MPKAEKEKLIARPPIVVVMGHIDHGKTTLLDYIRKTKVTETEAGGITQHVSAYEIEINNKKITFIDTPGHEAFSKIRERGAKLADVAILVIAADDKVNTQTKEALTAIKETNIPYIVAINKTDKETANPERIKKELAEEGAPVEEWGGKIPCANISAKTGQGVDELLELVSLTAELEDLKTDPTENASGFVVESRLDSKRGIEATLVIQNGTLKQGMHIAASDATAPVRIFENFSGQPVKQALASSPVKIIGFNRLPPAGAKFESFASKKEAEAYLSKRNAISFTETKSHFVSTDSTIIPLIIKADALGSAEAIEKQVGKIKTENIFFDILRSDVGNINEDDAKLAAGNKKSIIIGFNISCPTNIKTLAERFNIEIRIFNIIYEAEKWLEEEAEKRKPTIEKEEIIGRAKILKIFRDEKSKKIIGGQVISGKTILGKKIKIYRRDFLLGEGKISELQHLQEKKEEINENEQFGALIQTKVAIAPQDTFEVIS